MNVSAHQPAYLPWLGYLHRIAISDQFIILDDVQFEKNSYTNRNQVKGPNGAVWLTVPVSLKGHLSAKIRDIKIASDNRWAGKHLKTLNQAYSKSPFFNDHIDFFRTVFEQTWDHIVDINHVVLDYFLEQFAIDTPLVNQSELSLEGKKQELILDLCGKVNAAAFIFGKFGQDYVQREVFAAAGIEIFFHEYSSQPYPQLWGDFIPNLSALDMLFNVPADELNDRLMSGNEHSLMV